jgi:hypothetical protein
MKRPSMMAIIFDPLRPSTPLRKARLSLHHTATLVKSTNLRAPELLVFDLDQLITGLERP